MHPKVQGDRPLRGFDCPVQAFASEGPGRPESPGRLRRGEIPVLDGNQVKQGNLVMKHVRFIKLQGTVPLFFHAVKEPKAPRGAS